MRDGAAWQPADHYDRSQNGYLWEGHMGYDSVAHKADTHAPEDLFEKVSGLWQNINEVTRTEDAGERQDDCLILEYDSVYIPEGADCLVIDADALAQSTMDIYLDGVPHASFIVPEFDDLSGAGDNPGWAAAATAKNAPHGRGFRHTLNTIASSNSRRSRPVSFLIFSRRYTRVFLCTKSFLEVSDTLRLFSKNF